MFVEKHILQAQGGFSSPPVKTGNRVIKKDTMPYVDYHGKEALNFQITLAIAYIVAGASIICMIGAFLIPVLGLLDLIFCIIAALAASRGEYYKYPWCLRLVK